MAGAGWTLERSSRSAERFAFSAACSACYRIEVRAFALCGPLSIAMLASCFSSPPQIEDSVTGEPGDTGQQSSGISISGFVFAATLPDPEPIAGVRVDVVGHSWNSDTLLPGPRAISCGVAVRRVTSAGHSSCLGCRPAESRATGGPQTGHVAEKETGKPS
jgi:hypothetical protein